MAWEAEFDDLPWWCSKCDRAVNLTVYDRWISFEDEIFGTVEPIIGKCERCRSPYVLERQVVPESDTHDEVIKQTHPALPAKLPFGTPKIIRDAHDEALRCMQAHSYTATVLMARRGVEALCATYGERSGTLDAKLKRLKERGIIDQRMLDWSSVIRNLGNSGAHDVEAALLRWDASDAIAFLEALVNYLYAIRQRYELHQRRMRERASEQSDQPAALVSKNPRASIGGASDSR